MAKRKRTQKHSPSIDYRTLQRRWRSWKYKNTALLIVSLVVFYYLLRTPGVDSLIKGIGALGYFGAFLSGIFFVSTFTVAPAAVVLYHLAATSLHPVEIALLAGLGAMVGDYFLFRFMKDRVFAELLPLLHRLHTPRLRVMFKSPYFAWVLPVVGAFVIASPLPDEVGVSMLGLSHVKRWQFFLLAFTLNAIGIFLVVTAAQIVKL
ncbi:hypothetical protein CSA80_02520 [Candidatus Saccharibacteria bacterium]|nr:MAG: hypothetical protein CSA80_02520 [Candidatus Saccharibacteria bacterium]